MGGIGYDITIIEYKQIRITIETVELTWLYYQSRGSSMILSK